MGSSVSYNLATGGLSVLTLERFRLNHEFGSSHGRTRIIRLAYYEDGRYVPLLRRAFESWRDLERVSGRKLLKMTGGLMVGDREGALVGGVLRTAKEHDLPHRVLSASEAEDRFEAFTLDERFAAVYEDNAGILFPEECIQAYVGLAKDAGCEFRFSEPLTRWKRTSEGIEVASARESYRADKVVFCAGPWTSQLLGELMPLDCERQVPFWFASGRESCFTAAEMPVFITEEKPGQFFYGVPDVGHGVKVARTHGGQTVEPDKVSRVVTEEDSAPVRAFVSRRLTKLGRTPIASTTCLYTNTPDLNFVVGPHPVDPRLLVVSACSGHGFKFASVLGEVVADLFVDGRTAYDISFLNIDRFLER